MCRTRQSRGLVSVFHLPLHISSGLVSHTCTHSGPILTPFVSLLRLRRDRERQEQLARERLARRKKRGTTEEDRGPDEPDPDKGLLPYYNNFRSSISANWSTSFMQQIYAWNNGARELSREQSLLGCGVEDRYPPLDPLPHWREASSCGLEWTSCLGLILCWFDQFLSLQRPTLK